MLTIIFFYYIRLNLSLWFIRSQKLDKIVFVILNDRTAGASISDAIRLG